MRKLLAILLVASPIFTLAQRAQTEWSARASGGIFYYSGSLSVANQPAMNSFILPMHTNPYGSNAAGFYSVGASMKRVNAKNWFLQADFEFQTGQSKSRIDSVRDIFSSVSSSIVYHKATGKSKFRSHFISFAPSIGKRFKVGKASIDISAGPELAYAFSNKQTVSYSTATFESNFQDKLKEQVDLRLQFQVAVNFKRIGIFASYAHGIINSNHEYYRNDKRVFSNIARVGIIYRFK